MQTRHDVNQGSASRSSFASRYGAICATAGVAIGLGNIWRFPYMMGRDGGSAFLLLYVVFMLAIGAPVLMGELALGRAVRSGPWGAYERAGMRMGRMVSILLLLTVTMAASYYGVVVAWVLQESVALARGAISGQLVPFKELTESVPRQVLFLLLTVCSGVTLLAFGVRRGIERVSRAALPLFLVLLIVVLIRVLTLDGAMDGMAEFLAPQPGSLTWSAALSAMGQAVFSLGIGGTFMVLYGSYLRADQDIPGNAVSTVLADLGAAVLAGCIVMPAVIVTSTDAASGPRLLFDALPTAFGRMSLGLPMGAMFFAAVFVVAMLSLIAAYEVLTAALSDGLGLSRKMALALVGTTQIVLAIPAYLLEDYISISDLVWGSTMQPVGAALAMIALAWSLRRARALDELRRASRFPVPDWLITWCRYVIPSVMLILIIAGWLDWFGAL